MKLELKHLAPYLPYGLKWALVEAYPEGTEVTTHKMSSLSTDLEGHEEWWNMDGDNYLLTDDYKPILRPLSDLKSHELYPLIKDNLGFKYDDLKGGSTYNSSFGIVERLISYHFDVFGLIDKGRAIDINTLNK